jgi:hypothetical protein
VKRHGIAMGCIIIVAWMVLPLIPVVVAGVIASIGACPLDEGSVHPCIILGRDIGKTLYRMSMLGWFSLATFPTGILALMVFTVIVWARKWAAKRRLKS